MVKFAPLALAVSLLAGCALSGHPRINEIKYNPGRYQNRTVTVDGVVTSSWGVPLMPIKLYKVDDGTGEVTVVAHNGRVPSKGIISAPTQRALPRWARARASASRAGSTTLPPSAASRWACTSSRNTSSSSTDDWAEY